VVGEVTEGRIWDTSVGTLEGRELLKALTGEGLIGREESMEREGEEVVGKGMGPAKKKINSWIVSF
jgi:hypothetical protein